MLTIFAGDIGTEHEIVHFEPVESPEETPVEAPVQTPSEPVEVPA